MEISSGKMCLIQHEFDNSQSEPFLVVLKPNMQVQTMTELPPCQTDGCRSHLGEARPREPGFNSVQASAASHGNEASIRAPVYLNYE